MASIIQVANMAAVRMASEARITSLDDDKTVARTLKAVWDMQRRATLRDGSFNFSTRREGLGALSLTGGAPYPYANAFGMPADFLRLLEVIDPIARTDYQFENRQILANVDGPLWVRFIFDVPELAQWDDAAAEAFALRLACMCGRKIAGASFDLEDCWKEYEAKVGLSAHVDAMENPPIQQEESDWVLARMRYGGQ